MLLDAGADLNAKGPEGQPALRAEHINQKKVPADLRQLLVGAGILDK